MAVTHETEAAYFGHRNRLTPSRHPEHYKFYPVLTQTFDGNEAANESPTAGTRSLPDIACVLFSEDPASNPKAEVVIGPNQTIPFLSMENIPDDKDEVIDYALSKLRLNCLDARVVRYRLDLELRPWKRLASSLNYYQLPAEGMRGDYDALLPDEVRIAMLQARTLHVLSGIVSQPERCRELRPLDWIIDQPNFGKLATGGSNHIKIRHALGREATLVTCENWRSLV